MGDQRRHAPGAASLRGEARGWLDGLVATMLIGVAGCSEPTAAPQRTVQALSAIKCTEVVQQLTTRRGTEQHANLLSLAAQMRSHAPHADIPEAALVQMFVAAWQSGRPAEWWLADDLDRVGQYMLCRSRTREIVPQRYLALHPEYRQ